MLFKYINNMEYIQKKLINKQNLNSKEAFSLQEHIISGKMSKEQILEIFQTFDTKDITDEELQGIVEATRKHMMSVNLDFDVLDNCGTGGDKLHTINISTIAAVIVASLDVPVAKHGNRAASSMCGTADVLEALGVNIMMNAKQVKKCIEACGIAFMFAPNFHPALKYVKEARVEFGKKTYFNFIGPMLNPAGAKYQVIGISDKSKAEMMGKTLMKMGSKRVMLVHGGEGMDEISVEQDTILFEHKDDGSFTEKIIHPTHVGLKSFSLSEIQGGNAAENATIFRQILQNKGTEAQETAVLMNAAASLVVFGKAKDFAEGIERARGALRSGKAARKLEKFIRASNEV